MTKQPERASTFEAYLKPTLNTDLLIAEAKSFSRQESSHDEPSLFGADNGKSIGTYLEQKFVAHLMDKYSFAGGNSALGIDIPSVNVDIKVTSIKQPQSSCPFRSARQKIYGLGYNLIVFVYEKTDDHTKRTARLDMKHTIFVHKDQTGDYQTTRGLRELLERDANEDDIFGFIQDRNLPMDEIEALNTAKEILRNKPRQGYLTVSNALQWRLQYSRVIAHAGAVPGIERI